MGLDSSFYLGLWDANRTIKPDDIETYVIQLNNGELVSVRQLIDEANKARAANVDKQVTKTTNSTKNSKRKNKENK